MTRPTVEVSALITADLGTFAPPANTRGMLVACHREGTHAMTGVTFGGVALTAGHEITNAEALNDLHICTFYLDDYDAFLGRSSDVLDFTGGTLGGTLNDDNYRARIFWIKHPTHTVVMSRQDEGAPEVSQTQDITISLALGGSTEALGLLVGSQNNFNLTDTEPAAGTILYGPTQIDNEGDDTNIFAHWADITGTTAMGAASGAGINPHAAYVAEAWTEGVFATILISQDPMVLELAMPTQTVKYGTKIRQDPMVLELAMPTQTPRLYLPMKVQLVGGKPAIIERAAAVAVPTAFDFLRDRAHEGKPPAMVDIRTISGIGITDHGGLTGLADDDHPQYATNAEFDDHNARHESGGADAIKLDDLAAPDDNTDLNASTAKHGLLPKLPGGTTTFLRGDGSYATPAGAGMGLPIVRVYAANDTWAIPAGLVAALVEVVGGGGGGGGCATTGAGQAAMAAGGGGGGYARKMLDPAALSGSYTVTVGTGGAGGAAGNNAGSTGNASSFAGAGITTIQGNAGGGGAGSAAGTSVQTGSGNGGTATGGDLNVRGAAGGWGIVASGIAIFSGHGGGTVLAGYLRVEANSAGAAGQSYGGGGGGGENQASQATARAGGAGAAGVVIVTEYY